MHGSVSSGRNVTEAVICLNSALIEAWISSSVNGLSDIGGVAELLTVSFEVHRLFDCTYSGAAFSLSVPFLEDFEEDDLFNWTSNCHLSICSPVSLLVMTMTSFEIF